MTDLFYPVVAASEYGSFDIGTFLKNATETIKLWGGYLIMLLGAVLIVVGIYKLAVGLIGQGGRSGGPTNWAVIVIMILAGGAMLLGGWNLAAALASGGTQTIKDLGTGSGFVACAPAALSALGMLASAKR